MLIILIYFLDKLKRHLRDRHKIAAYKRKTPREDEHDDFMLHLDATVLTSSKSLTQLDQLDSSEINESITSIKSEPTYKNFTPKPKIIKKKRKTGVINNDNSDNNQKRQSHLALK